MHTLSFRTDAPPVPPTFFLRPLRDAFKLKAAELPVALGIRELIDRIEDDEILFDVRSRPTIGRAGVGEPI